MARLSFLALIFPLSLACSAPVAHSSASPTVTGVQSYTYEVVKTYPHDSKAYTQGLVYIPDGFYESTGQYGSSDLRQVNLADGKPSKLVPVESKYFAEGLTLLSGKLFQITWQEQKGFVYDASTFKRQSEFTYEGQGWGLATDGTSLILSDGTNKIRFLDPKTFKVQRTIEVFDDNNSSKPLHELNELEFIKGEIWANVWQTDTIVRIDPVKGKLLGKIDFAGLLGSTPDDPDDVLNGIAFDEKGDRIFVTGKRWPKLFEVKIKPKG